MIHTGLSWVLHCKKIIPLLFFISKFKHKQNVPNVRGIRIKLWGTLFWIPKYGRGQLCIIRRDRSNHLSCWIVFIEHWNYSLQCQGGLSMLEMLYILCASSLCPFVLHVFILLHLWRVLHQWQLVLLGAETLPHSWKGFISAFFHFSINLLCRSLYCLWTNDSFAFPESDNWQTRSHTLKFR